MQLCEWRECERWDSIIPASELYSHPISRGNEGKTSSAFQASSSDTPRRLYFMRVAGIFLPDVQDRRAAQASRAQEAGEVAADERDPRWCGRDRWVTAVGSGP